MAARRPVRFYIPFCLDIGEAVFGFVRISDVFKYLHLCHWKRKSISLVYVVAL